MTRDPRHDILFDPIKIGPVTAKNRFFQVPHCTGMGFLRPHTLAAMREVKAMGGWGVICTGGGIGFDGCAAVGLITAAPSIIQTK